MPEVKGDETQWAKVRLERAKSWGQAWDRLSGSIDPTFDAAAPANRFYANIAPPVVAKAQSTEPHLPQGQIPFSGMRPEDIADPVVRQAYIEARKANGEKARRSMAQTELRQIEKRFSPMAVRHLILAYTARPYNAEELKSVLDQVSIPAERKTYILDAVNAYIQLAGQSVVPDQIVPDEKPMQAAKTSISTSDLEQDLKRIELFEGDTKAAKELLLSLRQRWYQKDVTTYTSLTLRWASRISSIYGNIALKHEARHEVYRLMTDNDLSLPLRFRVSALQLLSSLPYPAQDVTGENNQLNVLRLFIDVHHQLKALKTELATREPLPPVDLSKYYWGNEVMISGMPASMIKDPVLRAAYQAALNVKNANLSLRQAESEAEALQSSFSRAFEQFSKSLALRNQEERNELRNILAPLSSAPEPAFAILKSRLNITGVTAPTSNLANSRYVFRVLFQLCHHEFIGRRWGGV